MASRFPDASDAAIRRSTSATREASGLSHSTLNPASRNWQRQRHVELARRGIDHQVHVIPLQQRPVVRVRSQPYSAWARARRSSSASTTATIRYRSVSFDRCAPWMSRPLRPWPKMAARISCAWVPFFRPVARRHQGWALDPFPALGMRFVARLCRSSGRGLMPRWHSPSPSTGQRRRARLAIRRRFGTTEYQIMPHSGETSHAIGRPRRVRRSHKDEQHGDHRISRSRDRAARPRLSAGPLLGPRAEVGRALVPEAALEALADQNISFTVQGKATYEQQMAAIGVLLPLQFNDGRDAPSE